MKNISDNVHIGTVSLWCEFLCEPSVETALKNVSDTPRTGVVSLWYESSNVHINYLDA